MTSSSLAYFSSKCATETDLKSRSAAQHNPHRAELCKLPQRKPLSSEILSNCTIGAKTALCDIHVAPHDFSTSQPSEACACFHLSAFKAAFDGYINKVALCPSCLCLCESVNVVSAGRKLKKCRLKVRIADSDVNVSTLPCSFDLALITTVCLELIRTNPAL